MPCSAVSKCRPSHTAVARRLIAACARLVYQGSALEPSSSWHESAVSMMVAGLVEPPHGNDPMHSSVAFVGGSVAL